MVVKRTHHRARPGAIVNGRNVYWRELRPSLVELSGGQAFQEVILDKMLDQALVDAAITIDGEDISRERKLLADTMSPIFWVCQTSGPCPGKLPSKKRISPPLPPLGQTRPAPVAYRASPVIRRLPTIPMAKRMPCLRQSRERLRMKDLSPIFMRRWYNVIPMGR